MPIFTESERMYLESLAIGVGYTWDSVQGTKKIVGKRDLHGKPVYLVKVGSRTGADFIPVDEIEQEVHLDSIMKPHGPRRRRRRRRRQ